MFEKWTDANDSELLNAQLDVIKIAHTAIGHLEALKKKELVLAALTMTQEEFDTFVSDRNHFVTSTGHQDHPSLDAPIPPSHEWVVEFEIMGDMGGVVVAII